MPSDPHERHERIDLPALMSVASLLPVGPIQRVIVCGSRDWDIPGPIGDAIWSIGMREALVAETSAAAAIEVIVGGARGADSMAKFEAELFGMKVRVERADWDRLGRRAGFERNARMLALSPNLVLAFKDGFDYTLRRGGTEHMCRIALATNPPTPVLLYSTAHGWERIFLCIN